MTSQSPHLDTTLVVRNVQRLANRQNQQQRGASGNCQLPPAITQVSVPAGERDSSPGGSSVVLWGYFKSQQSIQHVLD
jgi:hypothetical protein